MNSDGWLWVMYIKLEYTQCQKKLWLSLQVASNSYSTRARENSLYMRHCQHLHLSYSHSVAIFTPSNNKIFEILDKKQFYREKSRIRKTLNLLTNVDSSTDTKTDKNGYIYMLHSEILSPPNFNAI